ncbi:MAG: toxin-antitoxin system YwqK family antitoxin [Bacteroidia bacterium]
MLFGLVACNGSWQRSATAIAIDLEDENLVHRSELELHPTIGLVFSQDKPFTGTKLVPYESGAAAEKIQYRAGKKHGYHRKWFPNGRLGFEAVIVDGKRDGTAYSWWSNGNLRSEANYQDGKLHGKQLQWYQSGPLFKERNIVMGREEGIQRAWRENGKIYNNYQAKNGRIFGLKRANLCFQLDDEVLQYEDK